MSFGFSLDIKEQIRQATDIVDLVGQYVRLQPKGRVYVGLCPWHDDSKPSLQVDPNRQTYRCWVCNLGGDVFSFLQQMEGVSFPEALKMLAERAHIELPVQQKKPPVRYRINTSKERTSDAKKTAGDTVSVEFSKSELYTEAAWAETVFHDVLSQLESGHPVLQYLAQRNISAESIEKFRIGFAPNSKTFLQDKTQDNARRRQALELTGFLGRSEGGRLYERFGGRLLFPIHDVQGHTVGVGGRVVPGIEIYNAEAKYLNTPETALFAKHRLLYAWDLARSAMQKKQRAIVMEGYTDVIIAHQYGFSESVAVLGTALGTDHIRMLKRYVDEIYLVLDGDAAGQKRTAEVLELFLAQRVDVRIVTLPGGMDPAEFLETNGADALESKLKSESLDALTHAYNIYTQDVDFQNIHQTERALEKILRLVASGSHSQGGNLLNTNTYREEKILKQLAFRFSVDETFLRRKLRDFREEIRLGDQQRERYAQQREAEKENSEKKFPPPPPRKAGNEVEWSHPSTIDTIGTIPTTGSSMWTPDESEMPREDEEGTPFDDAWSDVPTESESGWIGFSEAATDNPTFLTGEAFDQMADTLDWAVFGKLDVWQQELLTTLFYVPRLIQIARKQISAERLSYAPAREIFLRMCELDDDGVEPTLERLLLEFESQTVKNWLLQLDSSSAWEIEDRPEDEVEKALQELLSNYARYQLAGRRPLDLDAFRSQKLDEEQKRAIFEQLIQEKRQANKIHRKDTEENSGEGTGEASGEDV